MYFLWYTYSVALKVRFALISEANVEATAHLNLDMSALLRSTLDLLWPQNHTYVQLADDEA